MKNSLAIYCIKTEQSAGNAEFINVIQCKQNV